MTIRERYRFIFISVNFGVVKMTSDSVEVIGNENTLVSCSVAIPAFLQRESIMLWSGNGEARSYIRSCIR